MEIEYPIKWKQVVRKVILIFFSIISVYSCYVFFSMINNFDNRITVMEDTLSDSADRQAFLESKLANCYPND